MKTSLQYDSFYSTSIMLAQHELTYTGHLNPQWKVGIVSSVWHAECTNALRDDAARECVALGLPTKNIRTIGALGSFEIPLLCKTLLTHEHMDGLIAFGVIVQGETHHAEIIARESARAIMDLQLAVGKPIIYEILFTKTLDDARTRCIGAHGKGKLAAHTLLTSLAKMEELRS